MTDPKMWNKNSTSGGLKENVQNVCDMLGNLDWTTCNSRKKNSNGI